VLATKKSRAARVTSLFEELFILVVEYWYR
jgi:hypothetical protein